MVDGLIREEHGILDEHSGPAQYEGGEEVDVDGVPGAMQLPTGARDVLCPGRSRESRWAEKLLLRELLPQLDPSPGDHVLVVVKHKALKKVFLL